MAEQNEKHASKGLSAPINDPNESHLTCLAVVKSVDMVHDQSYSNWLNLTDYRPMRCSRMP